MAEDWSGTIEVRSTLDGNVGNTVVERYRELASTHLTSLNKSALSPNSVLLTGRDDAVADPGRPGRTDHRVARRAARACDVPTRRRGVRGRPRDLHRLGGGSVAIRGEGRHVGHRPRRRDVRACRRGRATTRPPEDGSPRYATPTRSAGPISGSGCRSNSRTTPTNCASFDCICCTCCRRSPITVRTSTSGCRPAGCTARHIADTSSGTSCSSSRC